MTDERNNNNKNNSTKNNKTSNNCNKHTSAEATKIVLKNGLNGAATATATTLLTAPETAIKLPPPPPSLSTHANFALYAAPPPTATAAATTFGFSINNGISSTTLRTSTAAPEEATNHQRVSPSSSTTTATTTASTTATTTATTSNAMAAATATPTTKELLSASERLSHEAPSINSSDVGGGFKVENGGIIDYTLNANSSDIDRRPISATNELPRGQSFGGRLQFFKDGKFILELARSKDGEKGGWVSVPRKLFRAPSSATSSTITPTSTTSTTYPKNESSTSLSFSDDNSSIQSSPWQRDHCWKQAAPRYGISKEMSFFYQRPNQLTLSAIGLQASRKKRRRPFDNIFSPSWENTFMSLDEQLDKDLTSNGMLNAKSSRHIHDACAEDKPEGTISGSGNSTEDDVCSTSSTGTLTGTDCIDGSTVTQTLTPNSVPSDLITESEKGNTMKNKVDSETENAAKSDDKDVAAVKTDERMTTSDDDNDKDVSMAVATTTAEDETAKEQINGEVKVDKVEVSVALTPPVVVVVENAANEGKKAGGGEKRLKKFKSRAKLITIIQKLIDRFPTAGLLYLSKTLQPMISGNGGGATFNHSNSLANKISPPSSSTSSPASATTSRVVELQYHQQHVSPRKRILREFEKVSLEDTGAAGGKRSRAKGNTSVSSVKTSPQRVQSTSCAVLTSTSTATMATATNGCFNKSALKSTTSAPPTSSTPTRLYSSYSIHSLLGGGNSSSLNTPAAPSSASTGKRLNEHAVVSNISYQQQQHQHQNLQHNFPDPSYLRAMLASPKSPENNCGSGSNCVGGVVGGGKSPPNMTTKKRSPPYSSPLYENHSRSPTVSMQLSNDYGSRSPGAAPPESNYKIRFAAEHTAAASPSSQLQHQSFYSPYMMSPKYVPTPPTSMSPNSMSTANTVRSPRNSSVFNAHIPSSNASSAPNSIPTRELSPPRSATAPPRESTPRTVPKKTASIRRQFASPTSSASPSERVDDQQQERKTPHAAGSNAGTALQQNSFQTVSPNPHHLVSTLPASPLQYYMYAPNNAGSSSPNAVGSSSASGTSVAAQAAALAAAYIPSMVPPYYHPYISTLAALRHNPMWMHHYPGATPPVMPPHNSAASQASSRLSTPFINFPYNGVGAATVAAAAAAAAFGGPIPPSHFSQVGLAQQMSAPSAMHHAAGAFDGRSAHSTRLMTDENCIRTKPATKQTTASTIYPSSIKDDHSSDVPLNLSKH